MKLIFHVNIFQTNNRTMKYDRLIWYIILNPDLSEPGMQLFVIICSVKVYLRLDVTRVRAMQTCYKGANLIASF